jgi:hypothetical protein
MDTRRYLIALAMTTVLGAPVVAFSETPGHGGSHPTGFGASVAAQAGLQGNRWGPHNTIAFGGRTDDVGPGLRHDGPLTYSFEGTTVTDPCPCVVAHDPFRRRLGGVPISDTRTLRDGVSIETLLDKTGKLPPGGGSLGVIEEFALMQAVWGRTSIRILAAGDKKRGAPVGAPRPPTGVAED